MCFNHMNNVTDEYVSTADMDRHHSEVVGHTTDEQGYVSTADMDGTSVRLYQVTEPARGGICTLL